MGKAYKVRRGFSPVFLFRIGLPPPPPTYPWGKGHHTGNPLCVSCKSEIVPFVCVCLFVCLSVFPVNVFGSRFPISFDRRRRITIFQLVLDGLLNQTCPNFFFSKLNEKNISPKPPLVCTLLTLWVCVYGGGIFPSCLSHYYSLLWLCKTYAYQTSFAVVFSSCSSKSQHSR